MYSHTTISNFIHYKSMALKSCMAHYIYNIEVLTQPNELVEIVPQHGFLEKVPQYSEFKALLMRLSFFTAALFSQMHLYMGREWAANNVRYFVDLSAKSLKYRKNHAM